MVIRFLLGRAGSGKTRTCLNQIGQRLKESPHGSALIFLVPEQATFQMERALLTEGPVRATSRAKVLSFRRLAAHVLQETGVSLHPRLGPLGKRMALTAILQGREGQLRVFEGNLRQPGFVEQLEATLQEFRAWQIRPGHLETARQATAGAVGAGGAHARLLADKLHDLALIYGDFEKFLAGRFTDPNGILDEVARLIPLSAQLAGAEVWVDGFSGFNRQELEVLRALWRVAASTSIALCLDPEEAGSPPEETDLFAPTLATYHQLMELARADGVRLLPPRVLRPSPPPRFRAAPALAHLEAHLFEKPGRRPKAPARGRTAHPGPEGAKGQITVVAAADPATEVAAAAREILRLCREKGWRFRDISVLLRDLEGYEDTIRATFQEFGIPFFIDRLRPLSHHPLVELLRSALETHVRNWDPEPVFRCLRTDLFPVARDHVDRLENHVRARGIRDQAGFRQLQDQGALLPLHRLSQRLHGARTAADVVDALWQLLADLDVAGTLARWADGAMAAHRVEEAREHEGAWDSAAQLLEEMEETLGPLPLTPAACLPILEAGLQALRIGVIPPTLDQVLVGSTERSRQPDILATFILGASERSFPPPPGEDAILGDQDREGLAPHMELGPTSRTRLFQEQYLTYITLTRSSRYLWISYPTADAEGKALAPSPVIHRLKGLFPGLEVRVEPAEPASDAQGLERILNVKQMAAAVALRLRQHRDGHPVEGIWFHLYHHLQADPGWAREAAPVLEALRYRNDPGSLPPGLARALYGQPFTVSPSRLEDFAACPFRHFAAHGLKLREGTAPELDPVEVGSLLHAALRRFTESLIASGRPWAGLADGEIVELMDRCTREAIAEAEKRLPLSSPRHRFALQQLRRDVERTILRLTEHARAGRFTPVAVELGFGHGGRLAGLQIPLGDGLQATLRGQIDRVDVAEDGQGRRWVRIIDYKSRAQNLSPGRLVHGLSLQLPLYMAAVLESEGGGTLPAGMLYFPIREVLVRMKQPPVRPAAPEAGSAEAAAAGTGPGPGEGAPPLLPKPLDVKMQGLLIDDVDVLQLMDSGLQPGAGMSRLIPAGLTQRGQVHRSSAAAGLDRWRALLHMARRHAARMAREILGGRIDIAPYRMGGETPCRTCAYRSLCRFDPSAPGETYRRLPALAAQEAWPIIDKEGNTGGSPAQ